MRKGLLTLPIVCLLISAADAQQLLPISAHATMYFPHFADGGVPAQQWQTTFTFVNTNPTPVSASLNLFGDDGRPLPMDLGSGLSSSLTFTLPPRGVQVFRSRVASQSIVTGWALAVASLPVQATVAFRQLVNGAALTEITAEPTWPSLEYFSFATPFVGIALANPTASSMNVQLAVNDSQGRPAGAPFSLSIPPNGHTSFTLYQKVPGLPATFTGSIIMATQNPPDGFIAWTLNSDGNVISALPPGRLAWPASQRDQIYDAFQRIWASAQNINTWGILPSGTSFGNSPPQLQITTGPLNAAADANTLMITLGLSELISDSPSELAAVIGHEMGHVFQRRNGGLLLFQQGDAEFDADTWGTFLTLVAGYDPYGAAGSLGKLTTATGQAGLIQQFEAELAPDAHKSMDTRLNLIFNTLVVACAGAPDFCNAYKSLFHPDFPPSVPLLKPGQAEPVHH